jgi:hypothetical protein
MASKAVGGDAGFLVSLGVLEMVDREYKAGKAMQWMIGPAHPDFRNVRRIIRTKLDPMMLHYGIGLENIFAEAG